MNDEAMQDIHRQAMATVLGAITQIRQASDTLSRCLFEWQCMLNVYPGDAPETETVESVARTLTELRDSYAEILRRAHEAIVKLDEIQGGDTGRDSGGSRGGGGTRVPAPPKAPILSGEDAKPIPIDLECPPVDARSPLGSQIGPSGASGGDRDG